jgi:alpha/beta superfamily hydrolase
VLGFSFGAVMALTACYGVAGNKANVRAIVALGLPTRTKGRDHHYPFLANCNLPKLFLSGDHDQFAPVAQLTRMAAYAAEPKRLVLLPGADHFFTGQLEPMQQALAGWLKEQLP